MAVSTATVTTSTNTSSTSYIQLNGMTLTPGAGDFMLSFTTSWECSSGSTNHWFAVYVDGVFQASTERIMYTESSVTATSQPCQIYAYLPSVGVGEVVEIRYKTSGGTLTVYERSLILQEVDSADMDSASATAQTSTTSDTDALMNSMTVTPGAAGDYIIYFSTSVKMSSIGQRTYIDCYVGGVQQAHSERQIFVENSLNDDTYFNMGFVIGAAVGSSDAVEVKWRRTTTNTAYAEERELIVQKVDSYSQADVATDTTTTSTSYVAVNSMTTTPGSGGDYLAFYTSSWENSTSSNTLQHIIMRQDGTQDATTERQHETDSSCPNTSYNIATNAYMESLGASDAIDVYWKQAGSTAIMHERTLVVFEIAAAASGYGNDVFGVESASIGKVFGVETANIDKVFGS